MVDNKLSNYGDNIIGSEILKISTRIKNNVDKVYNYTIGDFDSQVYKIPQKLKEYIEYNFNHSNTNYPAPNGELVLRESISQHLKRNHFIDIQPNQILVGAGVRPLIYTIFKTLVDEGDEILYPVPSWNNNHYTFLHQGVSIKIECNTDNDFFPTPEQINEHIQSINLICLCSPQNPTGKVINSDHLRGICQNIVNENKRRIKCNIKPLYLFFDQIYSDLSRVKTEHPLRMVPEIKDYLICVDGISKSLSATGVRVGWMFGSENIIKKCGEIFSHIGAWANKPEQLGVAQYLSLNPYDEYYGIQTFLQSRVNIFSQITDSICDMLENLKIKGGYNIDYRRPDGAIYISLYLGYVDKFKDVDEMLDFLIDDCKVGLIPFDYFGTNTNKGWFRLSIGNIRLWEIHEHVSVVENMIINLEKR